MRRKITIYAEDEIGLYIAVNCQQADGIFSTRKCEGKLCLRNFCISDKKI